MSTDVDITQRFSDVDETVKRQCAILRRLV